MTEKKVLDQNDFETEEDFFNACRKNRKEGEQPTPAPVSVEEAAENYASTIQGDYNVVKDFKAGAKWQAAQLQSAPKAVSDLKIYTVDEIWKMYSEDKNYGHKSYSQFAKENDFAIIKKTVLEAAQSAPKQDGDTVCQNCGNKNPTWYADNELFNKVNGSPNGILCPKCFQDKADEQGISIIFQGKLLNESAPKQSVGEAWINALEVIPEIIHPLGKHWQQPKREDILLYGSKAKIKKADFDLLADYSASEPTGVYEGKMWKSLTSDDGWYLRWFGNSEHPDKVSNHQRKIVEWLDESQQLQSQQQEELPKLSSGESAIDAIVEEQNKWQAAQSAPKQSAGVMQKLIEWTEWLGEMGWYKVKGKDRWEHPDETGHFESTKDLVEHYNLEGQQLQSQQQNLFQKKEVTLHSGEVSDFKIDCDALTDEDLDCLAYLVSKKIEFNGVVPVPTGGNRFANTLGKYMKAGAKDVLICDDVLTTGNSIELVKARLNPLPVKGVVIFARNKCPDWVTPIFSLQSQQQEDDAEVKLSDLYRVVLEKVYKEEIKTWQMMNKVNKESGMGEIKKNSLLQLVENVLENNPQQQVEQQEDKISDEEIGKIFSSLWMEILNNADHSSAHQEHYAFFKAGFKACLQKGSEDKIGKAISWCEEKINQSQNEERFNFEQMKTFLQSL